MSFPTIDDAHDKLVKAVGDLAKPGFNPIPVTVVSVNDTAQGQLVVFDGKKFPKDEVVARLRLAADFLARQPSQGGAG